MYIKLYVYVNASLMAVFTVKAMTKSTVHFYRWKFNSALVDLPHCDNQNNPLTASMKRSQYLAKLPQVKINVIFYP